MIDELTKAWAATRGVEYVPEDTPYGERRLPPDPDGGKGRKVKGKDVGKPKKKG